MDTPLNQILLNVQDNGPGIPAKILAKLGPRGQTHGKSGGSGLGLYHARTSLEAWQGTLKIESQLGKGTTVTVGLPRATPPSWFVCELEIPPQRPVVVLDDDPTIHQVWRGRLESAGIQESGIRVFHFSRPDELRQWVQLPTFISAVYLMDYELLGFKETGLALIEELHLGAQAILVTSRFEEKAILEGCQRLGVRLIPKGMVGFVPIKVRELEAGSLKLEERDRNSHLLPTSKATCLKIH